MSDLIAAVDVGKTHTRVALIDTDSCREVWHHSRTNQSRNTTLGRQLDIDGIERWLIDSLNRAPGRQRISAIVPIAHGATAVLIGKDGEVLAAPDYEDTRFDFISAEYESERDSFSRSYSPSLPMGLNLGRQLFYLEQREPQLFERVEHILLYPQFWAWRLTGVMASEVTSLGCHTDLWLPVAKSFSALAGRHAWADLFPKRRFAGDVLGCALGPLAQTAGLPHDCRVVCGIHDSNASYLSHLIRCPNQAFATISSGTWTVVFASRTPLDSLHEDRDMLANVDVFGKPVATARFMGGREYEAIAMSDESPTAVALQRVIKINAMALPAFAAGGPFAGRTGQLLGAQTLTGAERAAVATLYMALMCDELLDSLTADGSVIIDGPLAENALFASVLARLRQDQPIYAQKSPSMSRAICFLAGFTRDALWAHCEAIPALDLDGLDSYRERWRANFALSRQSGSTGSTTCDGY